MRSTARKVEDMKIVFFGTPAFSCPFLRALVEDTEMEIIAVVTQPDAPVGRGRILTPSPVKMLAQELDVRTLTPESLKRDPDAVKALEALGADVFVVVAYGKLLPASVLQIPRLGVVNVHPSLLPRHRGPSPMQWAIREGDTRTGVSIMVLDEGMDTGPILARKEVVLDEQETYQTLEEKILHVGPSLLVDTLKRYARGEIVPEPQDESHATLTRLLEREDGHADWRESAQTIERKLRAYSAWPGLWSFCEFKGSQVRLKFLRMVPAQLNQGTEAGVVRVHEGRLFVRAGDGDMEILELQPECKPPMLARAFIAGHRDIDGARLV